MRGGGCDDHILSDGRLHLSPFPPAPKEQVRSIHPFVVGTPDGAAAMRRVLLRLKQEELVWLTDTDAMRKAAGMD